jgi:hypothetical protein
LKVGVQVEAKQETKEMKEDERAKARIELALEEVRWFLRM